MLRPGTFALTLLLAALSSFGPLSMDTYLPSMPDIARQLSVSASQVQFTISAYLVGFAVGQILYGPISDRYGRKPVLLGGLFIFSVATLACSLAASIDLLILARVFQALGSAGLVVVTRAIVRDLYTGARAGRELSIMASVMALGPVIAPIAGGILQTAFGWRSIFLALFIIGIMGLVSTILLLPETLRQRAQEPFSFVAMVKSYGVVLRNTAFLSYMSLGSSSFAGLVVWLASSAFVLQNIYGLSALHFGIVFASGAVGYMGGTAFAARSVATMGIDKVVGTGALIQAIGGLTMVAGLTFVPESPIPLIIAPAIYVAGMGMVQPPSIAGAMTPFPERAGAASSLYGCVQMSVAATGGVVIGLLMGDSAWPVVLMIAGFGLTTSTLWVLTRKARLRVVRS